MTWLDVHLTQVIAGVSFLFSLVSFLFMVWPTKPKPTSQWPWREASRQPVIRRPWSNGDKAA